MDNQELNHLFHAARSCLHASGVEEKLQLTRLAARQWREGELPLHRDNETEEIENPGRPERPKLVPLRDLPVRKLTSQDGCAAFIHALAHIEFNAINLAWDAVQRFPDLPADFYSDWIQVAREEVYHFRLLRERLREGGVDYGDFPAHNGLWEMAMRTAEDPLIRMALVPRMLEARGLDVTPGIMQRFADIGDEKTVAALKVILQEEVGHVSFGTRWFRYLCESRGLEPEAVL